MLTLLKIMQLVLCIALLALLAPVGQAILYVLAGAEHAPLWFNHGFMLEAVGQLG